MPVKVKVFDEQNHINEYIITNSKSTLEVHLIEFGSRLTKIILPDVNGIKRDVILGSDALADYSRLNAIGAVLGRTAFNIANAVFFLNGKKYQLPANDAPDSRNGGPQNFSERIWWLSAKTDNSVTLEYISEDGDNGYPGKIKITSTYTVTELGEVKIDFCAILLSTDQDTIINLVQEPYWNLNGFYNVPATNVLNHELTINSQQYLELKPDRDIPTGRILFTTDNTDLDYKTKFVTIGDREQQIRKLKGNLQEFNTYYVLEDDHDKFSINGGKLREVAVLMSSLTKIKLRICTTESVLNYVPLRGGFNLIVKSSQSDTPMILGEFSCVKLAAGRYNDAITHENWKNQVILTPNTKYTQSTIYKLSCY